MRDSVSKLLTLFNKKDKKALIILFLLMVVAALFETIGIGMIVPIVGVLTDPKIIHEQAFLSYFYKIFNFHSTSSFVVLTVISLLLVFVLKNLYLFFFNFIQYKVVLNQQVKLSRRLFKEYLTKPYTFHLQRNTAELLRNVNNEVPRVFQGIIISGFQLLTEFLVSACILVLLIKTAPLATISSAILLGGSIFVFLRIFRKKINTLGEEQQQVNSEMIKWVNQGLGASKEVKVKGKEAFFIDAYTTQSRISVNNSRYMDILGQVPRLFIETLLVSCVLITMLIIVFQGMDTTKMVSTMALFAMAAFRIMPSITRIMGLITTIRYSQPALSVIYKDLFMNKESYPSKDLIQDNEAAKLNEKELTFSDSIKLSDVSFRYPNQEKYSVKDVTLTIPIGQSIGFIGESGAGKTTLVDIILGLLQPEYGHVLVDGKNLFEQKSIWQKKIGYIPQSIYLTDDSVRGNVAFGIKNDLIDDEAVWKALEQAQLKQFVETLPSGLETKVGERGVRLSGGQRQRIGIARALYHNPEILFMDEATSSLDNETEKEIMKAINGLKGEKTLIIIAHRLSTIENCDIVFKINKGRLQSIENKLKQPSIM